MSLAIIVIIGWLYVTILVAANEPSIIAGIISFSFYGALPCGLILYFAGAKVRRQRQQYRQLLADQRANDNDRTDSQADQ